MKKILLSLSIVFAFASCDQTKIGYVKMEEVMKEYKGAKDREATFRERQGSIAQELDGLAQQLRVESEALRSNEAKLSKNAREQKEADLNRRNQELQLRYQNISQQLQQEGEKLSLDLNSEVDSLMSIFAKKHQFDLILSTNGAGGAVLYGADKLNVTDELLTMMNQEEASESIPATKLTPSTPIDTTAQAK